MKRISKPREKPGVALFILLSSLLVISFAMRDLIINTDVQIQRVRNSVDRTQAVYLARSTLNLSRFFIIFDSFMKRQQGTGGADTPADYWAQPIPFPVPIEILSAFQAELGGEAREIDSNAEDQMRVCREFFDDFQGEALAQSFDLSSRINLNDLDNPDIFEAFISLLTPNFEMIRSLEDRGINPEAVARQIRDFMDLDQIENETSAPEILPYADAQLPYEPKNRPIALLDEIRLVPIVDSELYEYLEQHTTATYFAGRTKPAKINLNTVGREVFQAILKDVASPEEISERFIADRQENARIYQDATAVQQLEEIGIPRESFLPNIVGGSAQAFFVKIHSQVNDTAIELHAVIKKPTGQRDPKPIVMMRIMP